MHSETGERMQRAENRPERVSCGAEPGRKSVCGRCQSCTYTANLERSTRWLNQAGQGAKRRFLTGLLLRCRSLKILHSVLQSTLGKDFTYFRARSRAPDPGERRQGEQWQGQRRQGKRWPGQRRQGKRGRALIRNPPGISVRETWNWFSRSPGWAQLGYLLRIFCLCEPGLLHRLRNLVRVLIAREKRGFLHVNKAKNFIWSKLNEATLRARIGEDSDTHLDSSEDPALMVVPGSFKSMSGVSLYRDFIRGLPVNISKRILGKLDWATLLHCKHVSQHWRYITEEVQEEIEAKKDVENEVMALQGSSSIGVNPVYARIREVLVPLGEEEDDTQHIKTCPSNQKEVRCLESVYMGVKTKAVELEERNVYCGDFNILILLSREDHNRVIHYNGGQIMAVGSKDRKVRLLDVAQIKEIPLLMQGHAGSVRAVLLCEERDLVISASYDLRIRCWNLKTGVCTMLLSGHMGTITSLDLHGDLLVSGSRDCKVKVWNLQTGKCCKRLKFGHRKPVLCVKISASLLLSSCEEGFVKVWEMETPSLLKILAGHQGNVKCLFFDQWHILSGGSDGQVLSWSTQPHFTKSLMTFHHPKEVLTLSLVFLRVITGCLDGKIRIFNFLSGDCLRIMKISTHRSPILSLHTHDNRILVNSSTRVLLLQFAEQCWDYSADFKRKPLEALQISPDGLLQAEQKAHSGSSSHDIHKWDRKARTQSFPQPTRGQSSPCRQQTHKKSLETSKYVMPPSVTTVREPLRKRGVHHPVNLKAAVRDSWGQPASDLAKSSQTKTPLPSLPLPPAKTHKWPHSAPKLSTESSFKGTAIIYTPLKNYPVDLNLRHSLHSREVSSSIPSPTLSRPQTGHEPLSQSKPKCKRPQTVCGVRKVSALTTTAEEDTQNIQGMLTRSPIKHSGRHVDFKLPDKPKEEHIPLDPFRKHGCFQLRTDSELQELIQSQAELQLTHAQQNKEKQHRTAGKQKIKGLPPNHYMKEDQVYAPELGEDTYI